MGFSSPELSGVRRLMPTKDWRATRRYDLSNALHFSGRKQRCLSQQFEVRQMSIEHSLWPGEMRCQAAGFPFVVRFDFLANDAPTLVFITGKYALARVFYGGHDGYNPRDFVSYWARENGYNTLAISYPVYGSKGVFDAPQPDMTTQDWGRGAAQITEDTLEAHQATGPVILAGWSMAGKSVQPFAAHERQIGIDLSFFSALASTPPIHGLHNTRPLSDVPLDAFGQETQPAGAPFLKRGMQIAKEANGREVIPRHFEPDYLGATPLQLNGGGNRYAPERGAYEDTRAANLDQLCPKAGVGVIAPMVEVG